jgi:tetratricopeptide (TPR) repeat protein
MRTAGITGELKAPASALKRGSKTMPKSDLELDPVQEAHQKALRSLADMLFEFTPGAGNPTEESGGRRSIARVVADGLLARGFDEKKIAQHLAEALEHETRRDSKEAGLAMRQAIEAGLDHPAAHFYLGLLLSEETRLESAQRSFQKAVKHVDYGLAARLLMADYFHQQDHIQDAAAQYLHALALADSAVIPEEQAAALRRQYEPLIEAAGNSEDQKDLEQMCTNVRHLLMRPSWQTGVIEARTQLPRPRNGAAPQPLADILTQANSGNLVDAMARISQIAREGRLRTAMEEAYSALSFAPNYLPLHVTIGELLLMQDRPRRAIIKFSTVARLYSARGESDRALQIYQRIVAVSPMNVDARQELIDQMTAHGEIDEAITQYVEMADVYYRQAMFDQALATYDNALRLVKSTDSGSDWNRKILHQTADIYLQRLDWRMALSAYEQLRTLNPAEEDVRLSLIELNLRLGQEAKANAELDSYLAYLASSSGGGDAGKFLRTAIEANEDFILVRRRLAEFHQQAGETDAAINEWNKVGELLVARGDREGAKAAVRAIIAMNPADVDRYQGFLRRLSD